MKIEHGSHSTFSEGFSLYVDCEDQAEVDEYWDKLVKAGAKPARCGWIKDPFGLSRQIEPRRFTELIRDKDPRRVKAVSTYSQLVMPSARSWVRGGGAPRPQLRFDGGWIGRVLAPGPDEVLIGPGAPKIKDPAEEEPDRSRSSAP